MATTEHPQFETWRLIVLDQNRERVFAVTHPTESRFNLPTVEIPRWRRIAENLTKTVREEWRWDAICLFAPTLVESIASDRPHYEVLESLQPPRADSSCVQVPIDRLTRDSFRDEADFLMIHQCVAELESYASHGCAPFVQVGWFRELQDWVAKIIAQRGLQLTKSFDQLNASQSFSLIRFATNGPDVWFKATGKPNLREFPITVELARMFPSYLPEIVGQEPKWNAWLSLSAGSRTLDEAPDVNSWCDAARALARLQAESVDQMTAIVNAGARDLRVERLSELAEPFFAAVKMVMHDTPDLRKTLSEEELERLCIRVRDSITLLEDLRIPDTLGHLDLNPANIALSQSGCKLLDWADAHVGNPFMSFQYLFEHFKRDVGPTAELQSVLSGAYGQVWQELLGSEVISEAMEHSRLVAAFAYAASLFNWRDEIKLRHPETAKHLNGMVRRMNREANELRDRGALC